MQLFVACDVCGHRYVLPGEREGRNNKCKSCGTSFEVSSDNEYDPETSEFDEDDEGDDEEGSSLSPLWMIARMTGHVVAGLVTLTVLIWMSTLLFRSPREAWSQQTAHAGIPTVSGVVNPQYAAPQYSPLQRPAPQVISPSVPQISAQPAPIRNFHVGQFVYLNVDGRRRAAVIRRIEPNGDLTVHVMGGKTREQVISPSSVLDR